MPLTDVAIRSAKPSEKARRLSDGAGLYLEVSPAGGKWWRFKFHFDGKEKRLSLGVYPDVGLKDARERRDDARRLLANGIDPAVNRKVQKAAKVQRAADSFEVIGREWFAHRSPSWVKSHGEKILRRLEVDVFPWLGDRPISEITAPEVLKVLRRIAGRGTLDTAHRARSNCCQIFRYAIQNGRAPCLSASRCRCRHGVFRALKRRGGLESSGQGFGPGNSGEPWRYWPSFRGLCCRPD